MSEKIEVDRSDFMKIYDALFAAQEFFEKRDQMNSKIHLGEVIYSPITSRLQRASLRMRNLFSSNNPE